MTTLRLMSFNIKCALFEDGENNWVHRAPINVATIRQQDPDLIGFQEVQPGNVVVYTEHLPEYTYVLGVETARENETGSHYYCAIYWKRDRFDLIEQGAFYLNETPERYALDWGVTQGRTVNWVKLLDKHSGQRLLHVNTHLPHDSEQGRINSARLIVERLPALSADVDYAVATADFNSRAYPLTEAWLAFLPPEQRSLIETYKQWFFDSTVYQTFMAAGLRDTFLEAGYTDSPENGTFHGLRGENFPKVGHRIDWILIRDGAIAPQVRSFDIVRAAAPPVYTSDHYPIVALLET